MFKKIKNEEKKSTKINFYLKLYIIGVGRYGIKWDKVIPKLVLDF